MSTFRNNESKEETKTERARASKYRTNGITDASPVLKYAVKNHKDIFNSSDEDLFGAPVAMFYDMDLWDEHLNHCTAAFGPTFQHFMAIKANSLTYMMKHAYQKHRIGAECASIGEVIHAIKHCGIPNSMVVFDSPCKTLQELCFAIKEKIHVNMDNFEEFNRAKRFIERKTEEGMPMDIGVIGLRINPLVGAGKIAALSVSTSESKFGIPLTQRENILDCYLQHPWLNCIHVHVGSGGMGSKILIAGIRNILDMALEINAQAGTNQIKVVDIGGGIPANYSGDSFASPSVPTYSEYAVELKACCPELFDGRFAIKTEFGQSLNAKSGMLISRIEYLKTQKPQKVEQDGNDGYFGGESTAVGDKHIAIIHFGADCCVRQVYDNASHARRIEAYKADGSRFEEVVRIPQSVTDGEEGSAEVTAVNCRTKCISTSVAGPLCFQGDFVAKDLQLPVDLNVSDFIVMKDAGAVTLSAFSRHCSRLCPPVYGFRWNKAEDASKIAAGVSGSNTLEDDSKRTVREIFVIKPRETMEQLSTFWGV